jgi:cytochrome c553
VNARPSTGVGAMNDAAASLTDDEIKAIAAYLETYK